MSFSRHVREEAAPILDAIHRHPFNQELAKGTLRKETFQFYLKQDSLYLIDFARALAIAGARAPRVEDMAAFLQFAQGAVSAERSLHQHYFDLYEIHVDVPQGPGCFSYTQFLLTTAALRDQAETVSALLPCFWVYREVGRYVQARSGPENPYRKWIDTYAGTEFDAVVSGAISLLDRAARQANPRQRALMRDAFLVSCRLEWMFWDSAYRLEKWMPAAVQLGAMEVPLRNMRWRLLQRSI